MLTLKMEELENRQRRSNLRLVGLPEGSENGGALTFLMEWLPKALNMEAEPPVTIEQAFRIGNLPQNRDMTRGTLLRFLLVKFLMFHDRDRVMNAVLLKKSVTFEGSRVMFFPGLSAEVQKQQRLFSGVKQGMRDLSIEFGLLFPAKMLILCNGKQHFFSSPSLVEDFIRKIKERLSQKDAQAEHGLSIR